MKLKAIFFSLLIAASISSCKVSFLPKQNAEVVANVLDLSNATTSLYDNMITSADKKFSTYANDYSAVDLKISFIVDVNKTRPKAANILKQTEILQNYFSKYEAEHKAKGTLTNAELKTYKDYIASFIKPILVSELSLK